MENKCPYCSVDLEKEIKRTTDCKGCGKTIYVTTNSITKVKFLITEDEYKKEKYLKKISILGISNTDFYELKEKLSKSYGFEAKNMDVIWALLNKKIGATNDLHSLKMIYFTLAQILLDEGKDFNTVLREKNRCDLLKFKQGKYYTKVKIMAGVGCDSCKIHHGEVYTIDEALKLLPLPNLECTNHVNPELPGWCRCYYAIADSLEELGKRVNEAYDA